MEKWEDTVEQVFNLSCGDIKTVKAFFASTLRRKQQDLLLAIKAKLKGKVSQKILDELTLDKLN